MTDRAQAHLAKAKDYIAKGDEFYRRAKIEISVAIEQDPLLSQQDIATAIGMSKTWVADVIRWDGTGTLYGKDTERRQMDMAKQVLRESHPEQVAEILDDPQINRNVTEAALLREERTAERVQREQRDRVPGLVRSAQINEVLNGMISAKLGLTRTLRELQKTPEIREDDREDLLTIVAELKLEVDWIESFLTAGTTDIDSELEAILGGA